MSVQQALRAILSDARVTALELADVAGCSDSHIYKAASPREECHHLNSDKLERIARYLSDRGDNRLAEALLVPRYVIVPRGAGAADGQIEDELRDLIEVAGVISETHRDRNSEAFNSGIVRLSAIINRIRAEGALL